MLSSRSIHHIMIASIGVLLFAGHTHGAPPATARCEGLTDAVVADVLEKLAPPDREYTRSHLAALRAPWIKDRSHARVSDAVAQIPNVRSLVRLEIAGGRGPGYESLWFVDAGDDVFEFSTSYMRAGYWRGTIPREQWSSYARYLNTMTDADLEPILSTTSTDAPIYFLCLLLDGREAALLVEPIPEDVPQLKIIARTLALARSRVVPRELQSHPHR